MKNVSVSAFNARYNITHLWSPRSVVEFFVCAEAVSATSSERFLIRRTLPNYYEATLFTMHCQSHPAYVILACASRVEDHC